MLKPCLMASHGYPPGPALLFHPEQGLNRAPKHCQHLLPNPELRQDIRQSGALGLRHQTEESWKPVSGLFNNNHFVKIDSTVRRPILIDVQDAHSNSTLFSFESANQSTRHDEIFNFLTSGLSEVERHRLDLSLLSDLMGLQALMIDHIPHQLEASDCKPCFRNMPHSESQIIYPTGEFDSPKPLVDFVGHLGRHSEITFHDDARVLLTGTRTDLKDILSILAEFYLSSKSSKWRSQSVLVPQFNRLDCFETGYYVSPMELETVTVAPLKSPEKVKFKPSPKKKGSRNKAVKERELHRTNYLQACESLLSIIVDKNRNAKVAIPVLKKSGPELPNLLTQFSASIAGTGLAVLFSVICKVGSGRVPFCASKFLNTGLGLGLVWLSWAVNRLRDTIVGVSKNSNKKVLKDEDIMKDLDSSVKQIYFRAATLVAVMVLRLA